MTPRTKRLQPLLKIASKKQDNAATVLASSNNELKQYQDKLEQMQQYRNEYTNNMSSSTISIQLLRDKQKFIKQIDQAIEMLKQQIEQLRVKAAHDQTNWLQAKQKNDAYDKIIEKIEITEQKIQDEHEQREIDDRVCKLKTN